jgi:hypothetical protein
MIRRLESEAADELLHLTGLAAALFCCGLAALTAALYRGGTQFGPLMWIGLALLVATVICWFMAARARGRARLAHVLIKRDVRSSSNRGQSRALSACRLQP